MAGQRQPTTGELRFAYQLLRQLNANTHNPYLVIAIIAWMRSESGLTYIGNNPLNIRQSRLAIRYRRTVIGDFAVFSSLTAAANATAIALREGRGMGYEVVIRSLRRQMPSTVRGAEAQAVWQQTQAQDFIINIALSRWSVTHFGLGRGLTGYRQLGAAPSPEQILNAIRIYPIWIGLTGTTWQVPQDRPVQQPEPPPPAPEPEPAKSAARPGPQTPTSFTARKPDLFLDPQAAYRFYEARREDDTPAIEAPLRTEW